MVSRTAFGVGKKRGGKRAAAYRWKKAIRSSGVLEEPATPPRPPLSTVGTSPNENSNDSFFEKVPKSFSDGKRRMYFVDVPYFLKQLQKHRNAAYVCSFGDMEVIKEKRRGLETTWTMKCKVCREEEEVVSERPSAGSTNNIIANAPLSGGFGFEQLSDFLGAVGVNRISQYFYEKSEKQVRKTVKELAWDSLIEAGKEEAVLAEEARAARAGSVDEPLHIEVYCDGTWSHRSYNHAYKARSGMACIIGVRTGKVLFYGVKNSYCLVCTKQPGKQHQCYRNWSGAPNGMEAAIIQEGFNDSVDMHRLQYTTFIGDGDSSTFSKVVNAYGPNTVTKVECIVHLLRVFMRRVRALKANTKFKLAYRKAIGNEAQKLLRKAIKAAACYWRSTSTLTREEKVTGLQKSLRVVVKHALGSHKECSDFFCNPDDVGEDAFAKFAGESGFAAFLIQMNMAVGRLCDNAESLLDARTTNACESFNAVVARYNDGKRINICHRDGYDVRAAAAVLQHNSQGRYINETVGAISGMSPGSATKRRTEVKRGKVENNRKRKLMLTDEKKRKKKRITFRPNKDYGAAEDCDPIPSPAVQIPKTDFLASLRLSEEEAKELEQSTVLQSSCMRWRQERAKRLTASNFGRVLRITPRGVAGCVQALLSFKPIKSEALDWGRSCEPLARNAYEESYGVKVTLSGLVVSVKFPFLAASPGEFKETLLPTEFILWVLDGVIADDEASSALLEIKCPWSCRDTTSLNEALPKLPYLSSDGSELVKCSTHHYLDQIQGQMFVTRASKTFLYVWTPQWSHRITVLCDPTWAQRSLPKLERFYMDHILPNFAS